MSRHIDLLEEQLAAALAMRCAECNADGTDGTACSPDCTIARRIGKLRARLEMAKREPSP